MQGLLYSSPLLAGDTGTEQTVNQIRRLVDDAWKDSVINRTAIEIVRNAGVQPFDTGGQIRAIYDWVRENFYFVNDPVTKEALRPTRDLLEMRAGDCDDINAIVLPSLLGTIGLETRLVTIAADSNDPTQFSHVYSEVSFDGEWIAIDAARPGAQFGVAPPSYYRREWWSLIDDSHSDYSTLGRLGQTPEWMSLPTIRANRPALRGLAGYGDGDISPADAIIGSALNGAIGPGGCAIASSAAEQAGCGCDGSDGGGISGGVAAFLVIGALLLFGGGK